MHQEPLKVGEQVEWVHFGNRSIAVRNGTLTAIDGDIGVVVHGRQPKRIGLPRLRRPGDPNELDMLMQYVRDIVVQQLVDAPDTAIAVRKNISTYPVEHTDG
jgi:hypothetical protein